MEKCADSIPALLFTITLSYAAAPAMPAIKKPTQTPDLIFGVSV